MKAIVLSGGLGTRLRSEVSDVPKTMAPVNGRPFLEYILDFLISSGIEKIILSLGYKADVIISHFGATYKAIPISYHCERSPLGTGGGVRASMEQSAGKTFVVVNGDTYFPLDIQAMWLEHKETGADVTVALKYLSDSRRYGTVILQDERIIDFKEKMISAEGYINGGTYILNRDVLSHFRLEEAFSLEKDFFEKFLQETVINGFVTDAYFIDIGVPKDYRKAHEDFM